MPHACSPRGESRIGGTVPRGSKRTDQAVQLLNDDVMTPAGGFALMIGEDALDRFVVKKLEGRVRSAIVRATARLILNPSRSTANVAALRAPGFRQDRPLRQPPVSAPVQ